MRSRFLTQLYEVRFARKGMPYLLCHIQLQMIRGLNPASHGYEDHNLHCMQRNMCFFIFIFLHCSKSPAHTRHFLAPRHYLPPRLEIQSIFNKCFGIFLCVSFCFSTQSESLSVIRTLAEEDGCRNFSIFIAKLLHQCNVSG